MKHLSSNFDLHGVSEATPAEMLAMLDRVQDSDPTQASARYRPAIAAIAMVLLAMVLISVIDGRLSPSQPRTTCPYICEYAQIA